MILSASLILSAKPASYKFALFASSTSLVTRSEFWCSSVLCFSMIAAMLSCTALPSARIVPTRSDCCAIASLMVVSMYSR